MLSSPNHNSQSDSELTIKITIKILYLKLCWVLQITIPNLIPNWPQLAPPSLPRAPLPHQEQTGIKYSFDKYFSPSNIHSQKYFWFYLDKYSKYFTLQYSYMNIYLHLLRNWLPLRKNFTQVSHPQHIPESSKLFQNYFFWETQKFI